MATPSGNFETSKNSKYTAYISCAVFIIVYVLAAIGSLKFATINSSISPVWPPSGLSIGFLLLFGPRYFYCVFIGALIANFYTSGEVLSSFLIAGGNCIEAVVGFFTVHWIRSQLNNYEHLKDLMAILVSSLFASVFSASVGALTLMAMGSLSIEHVSAAWLTWWIADAVGSLFIVPLVLFFLETRKFSSIFYTLKQKAGLIFLITGTLVATYYLLQLENSLKLIFLLFPILLLISQIRQRLLVYLFSVILGIIPIYLTVTGKGPFVHSGFNQNLLNLEIFIVALLTTSICIIGTTNLSAQRVINTIYLVGWVLWGTIFYYISDSHHKNDEQRMSHQMSLIEQSIETQINIYVNYLAGAKGLFEASDEVKPLEWKKYVAALDLVARGTGLSGMGVIQKVKNSELASFVKKQAKETGLNIKINDLPGGSTSPEITEKYIVSLIEPFDSNSNALGLNIASEVKRKATADLAAATGKPMLSEAIHIYQDKGNRPGFLLYMPVYKKNFPLSSEENRTANLSHWIYSPFVAENFFNSILKNQGDEYIFEIFNGKTDNDLVYRSSKIGKSKSDVGLEKVINIYGQDFLIRWARSVNFVSSSDFLSTWIGFIGALSIILIILFFCNIYLTEEKASKLAEEYIHEYSLAQDKIRQQESKLVDSARLVSLGEMAGNIAHEINTPLAVISSNAQLLNKYISNLTPKQEDAKATEHVAKILITVKKISNIIQGLRKISRNANGDKMSLISSRQLVEETMAFCTERLKNLDIHFSYSDGFSSDIYCREVELSQVLVNLINNSVDAISDLPKKWITIDITSINSLIKIRVTDSGDGIPKHLRDKILLPFFTTKEIGKGTGIGLSISKGIVESHGGRFYLDTDHPNTSFVIELPIPNLQRLSA